MEKFSEEFQKKIDVWSKIYKLMEGKSEDVPVRNSIGWKIRYQFYSLKAIAGTICHSMPEEDCTGCPIKERLDICWVGNYNLDEYKLMGVEKELSFLYWLILEGFSREEIDVLQPYFDVAKNRLNRRRAIRF